MKTNMTKKALLLGLLFAIPAPFVLLALQTIAIDGAMYLNVDTEARGIQRLVAFIGTGAGIKMYLTIAAVIWLVSFFAIRLAAVGAGDEDSFDSGAADSGGEAGTVKWFNVNKGFGFITRDSGEDIFVHFRNIRGRGHRSLRQGQRVQFVVIESDKGLQADNVSVVR